MSMETQVTVDARGGEVRKVGVDPNAFSRLRREEWMLRGLEKSPHVPQLISASAIAHTLTIEYIAGQTFAEVFAVDTDWNAQEAKSWEEALPYLQQYVDAEQDLLRRGFLYRDLNPRNIIFAGDRAVLVGHDETLIDIEEGARIWSLSSKRGTWETMAPEEFRGRGRLTERTATYRTAALAHLALSGSLPFLRFSTKEESHHWRARHRPQIDRELPRAPRKVLRKALDRRPKERHANPKQFFKALKSAYEDTV